MSKRRGEPDESKRNVRQRTDNKTGMFVSVRVFRPRCSQLLDTQIKAFRILKTKSLYRPIGLTGSTVR